jgi:hypothetical protein
VAGLPNKKRLRLGSFLFGSSCHVEFGYGFADGAFLEDMLVVSHADQERSGTLG